MKRRTVGIVVFVFTVVFGGSLGFMYLEGRTFLESLYFVVATVTTVGYGDIVPTTEAGIIFSIILIIFGACAVLAILPLAFSYLVEKDIRAALGFEKIPKLKEHIIICRYNELAEQALEEIKAHNIPYIIIENDEDVMGELRDLKMPYVTGDASEERVLEKAMIYDAASIILASRNDSENTFTAMAARQLNPHIKIIARVESSETVPIYKSLDIDVIIDPQEVTLKTLVKNALSPYAADLLDEVSLFKNVNLGQFQVSQDSAISGKRISDTKFREKTGASIVAILKCDEMYPNPALDRVIEENEVLLVLGTSEQLQRVKALVKVRDEIIKGERTAKDHVIICGFGYNGKKVANELRGEGVEYVIIERDKKLVEELYGADTKTRYIGYTPVDGETTKRILIEDAKSEETLKRAGIESAKALLITVGNDAEVAFIALVARNLNPNLTIIAKANKLESMRKIYRAGATNVVSSSVIGGKMAARAAVKPIVAEFIDRITLMKDFEMAQFKIGKDSKFYKKQLKDLKLSSKKVSILAIHHEGELIANPPPDAVLDEEDVIVVLGPSEALREIA